MPGAPQDWALPYWDYNSPVVGNPRALPEAFAKNNWPDGGDNPLFDERRFGRGDGRVVMRDVDLDLKQALSSRHFEGQPNVSPGFGGMRLRFSRWLTDPTKASSNNPRTTNFHASSAFGSFPSMIPPTRLWTSLFGLPFLS